MTKPTNHPFDAIKSNTGLSRKELALELGVSPQFIDDCKNGKSDVLKNPTACKNLLLKFGIRPESVSRDAPQSLTTTILDRPFELTWYHAWKSTGCNLTPGGPSAAVCLAKCAVETERKLTWQQRLFLQEQRPLRPKEPEKRKPGRPKKIDSPPDQEAKPRSLFELPKDQFFKHYPGHTPEISNREIYNFARMFRLRDYERYFEERYRSPVDYGLL